MNTPEQFVANDLGTIIANQSITIAKLKVENQQLKARNAKLQEMQETQRKKVKDSESKTNSSKD